MKKNFLWIIPLLICAVLSACTASNPSPGPTVAASTAAPTAVAQVPDASSAPAVSAAPTDTAAPAASAPAVTNAPAASVSPSAQVSAVPAASAPASAQAPAPTAAQAKFSVSCAILLNNMDKLSPDKASLVPKDGMLVPQFTMQVDGQMTALSALQTVSMITMTPIPLDIADMAGSKYVKAIGNLYEKDAGPNSGWVYKVNGKLGTVAASDYVIQPGDNVEWLYTLDSGNDV